MTDFTNMTGQQLVDAYNEMVATWVDLGGDNTFGTVKRFPTVPVGQARCERLHSAIQEKRGTVGQPEAAAPVQPAAEAPEAPAEPAAEAAAVEAPAEPAPEAAGEEDDEMAKRKAKAKAKAGAPKRNGGPTVKGLTDEYNSLVGTAKRAGIKWAKHHTSLFGSLVHGKAQVDRLKKAIAAANK